jgi:hypothetical protein
MRTLISLPILAFCLSGCGTFPASRGTPYLPPGVYGVYEDNDVGAINQSAWAFGSAANTRGNPIDAAKAIVALEYLSGELRENPRFFSMDQSIKFRMGLARDQLRAILGIRPGTPSQVVVNTLLALSLDLQTANGPAAGLVLTSPIFLHPPQQTMQILSNLPYVQEANLATARAQQQTLPFGNNRG